MSMLTQMLIKRLKENLFDLINKKSEIIESDPAKYEAKRQAIQTEIVKIHNQISGLESAK